MKIVENKLVNILFQVFISLGLAGVAFYFLQEIVTSMLGTAYTVLIVIADFIGIFAIISIIVWFFIGENFKTLVQNLTYLLGAVFILFYSFAHFFVVMYASNNAGFTTTGNFLQDFISLGSSFIGLLLLFVVTIGVIVFFSLKFTKRETIAAAEKFTILLWILLIGIYDFAGFYYVKQYITFDAIILQAFGISFLPTIIEFIFLLFAMILIVFDFFTKTDKKILTILTILFVNVIFIAFAITSINYIGFDFTNIRVVPSIIGNHLLMLGALGTIVTTFFVLLNKFPEKITPPPILPAEPRKKK